MESEPRSEHLGLFGLKMNPTYFVFVTNDQALLEINRNQQAHIDLQHRYLRM